MPKKKLSHIDDKGRASMVDVTGKASTAREAVAAGTIRLQPGTLRLISENRIAKGNVLETARLAGIMAAKKTSDLIPLCHPLNVTSVSIEFDTNEKESRIDIRGTARCTGQTGVEMEALTAVSAAALTIYDMCKAVDREMIISDIMLLEKRGGKSGEWVRVKSLESRV
jgi:cyclic pyranopterin phosphate synthase